MDAIFWDRQRKRRVWTKRTRLQTISRIATAVFLAITAATLLTGILFAWYAKDLPRPDRIVRSEGLSTVVVDRNGESLYNIFEEENRIPVAFDDIPQYLREATIAIEDKDFYSHQGFSRAGIIRALVNTVFFRSFQGGSTLTQQLVKNVLLTQERTLPRKMKEAVLAIQIERKYSKDDIILMYLNEAPYGGTAVGVEAASRYYFDKPVRELTLVESVILAGLPQAPSRYSPFGADPSAYIWRSEQVLRRMREDGYITSDVETLARSELANVSFAKSDSGLRAPHFVAYVKELLIDTFGADTVERGGMRVTTTLDWTLQEKAQAIVASEVEKAKKLRVSNGASVAIDPSTGEILAMVGSKDYAASESGGYKFNVVTQGLRQPGSAIKPVTYATAFKKGYTASTVLMDVDTKYPSGDPSKPEYNPKNYDEKFRGPVQLRFALGNSINTIAVKVTALIGIRDVLRTAYDMGLNTLEPTQENTNRFGLAITLGGAEVKLLELTSAFGVFATGGIRHDPIAILKVEDSKGKVIFEHKPSSGRRVLGEDVAYLVSDILSDNDARRDVFGTRSHLVIPGATVAVKTGTTDDKRDNWTVGYTKTMAVGTWVGNNDNSPMHPSLASGVTGAAPIWNRIMREALKGKPNEPFERPSSIVEREIDAYGGGLPAQGNPTRFERYREGTQPIGASAIYQFVKVSKKDSSKLANSVEVARGEYDTFPYVVFTETDPVSTDGSNRWQDAINAWVATQTDAKFHPPTETYSGTDQLTVEIREPGDKAQVNGNAVRITVESASLKTVTNVQLFIDGILMKESSEKRISETFSLSDGNHAIKARATDETGAVSEREIHISVNTPYENPTPVPSPPTGGPTAAPTPTP